MPGFSATIEGVPPSRAIVRRAALLAVLAIAAAFPASYALAQSRNAPPPPKLEPLPEPPPPAIGVDNNAGPEAGVRLSPEGGERIEETVIDGRRVVRVLNPNGTEYMLIEDVAGGTGVQGPGRSPIAVPLWVIRRW